MTVTPFAAEEADDRIAIWTPDLRLRFTRSGDRWTHAIDLGPGPWQTVADAVEWSETDPDSVLGPVYQEIHLHQDDHGPAILAVGRVGAHHVSASFRLKYRSWRALHPYRNGNPDELDDSHEPFLQVVQDRSSSSVIVDVADRCRTPSSRPEARYRVHQSSFCYLLGNKQDYEHPAGWTRDWRGVIVWETKGPGNYDVALIPATDPPNVRFSILECSEDGDCLVRAASIAIPTGDTCRFTYSWSHDRVRSFDERKFPGVVPPWQLTGAIPPDDLTPV